MRRTINTFVKLFSFLAIAWMFASLYMQRNEAIAELQLVKAKTAVFQLACNETTKERDSLRLLFGPFGRPTQIASLYPAHDFLED